MRINRISKLALFILIAISISLFVNAEGIPVCCCYPGGGGDLLPETECEYEKDYDVPIDLNCSTKCEEVYVPPVITNLTCDDPDYDVSIELEASLIRGSRAVVLSWSSPCEPEYYEVIRKCKESFFGCDSTSEVILSPSTSSMTFIDNYAKWDTEYTYIIKGHFALQGDKIQAANASTGNLECWYKYDTGQFCVNENTYYRYRDFLINDAQPPFQELTFYSSVNAKFYDKLKKGYYCDDQNRMHQIKNCNQIGGADDCDIVGGVDSLCSCVDRGATVECAVRGDCNNDNADPFGLYFQKEDDYCLGTQTERKYCFLDRSPTSLAGCYSCDTRMDCYDYKSQDACQIDNCGFDGCVWEDTIPELGIGVCKSADSLNCMYCMQNGTRDATNLGSYNTVFDQCSTEKAEALSTGDEYKCYFNGLNVSYCMATICIDYRDQQSCQSNDPCGIGICQWYGLEHSCYKDGDSSIATELRWMDCAHIIDEKGLSPEMVHLDEDFRACQKDYFAPNMTITPTNFKRGLPRNLEIKLKDQKAGGQGGVTIMDFSKEDYTLYFCLNNEAGTCLVEGDFITVTQNSLDIYNLNVTEVQNKGKSIRYLFELKNGENRLKYYARDPSNNLGQVMLLRFNASENASGPRIAFFDIDPGNEIDGYLYSNSRRPTINVTFLGIPEVMIRKDIYLGTHNQMVTSDLTWVNNVAQISLQSNLGDDDGYSLILDARGVNGLSMDDPYHINFTIDRIPPVLILLEPELDSVIHSSSLVTFEARYNEKVILNKLEVNGENYANLTETRNNETFTATRVYLVDGSKELNVEAEDYATNHVATATSFTLNAVNEIDLKMIRPTWGVSSEQTFDIELSSDNDAACSYYFSLTPPGQIFESFYADFPQTGATSHILSGFNNIPPGDEQEYALYVKCDDGYWDSTYKTYNISVDTRPPQIEEANANPDIIVDTDLNTSLNVMANERVVCRYDSEQKPNYAELRYSYDDPIELANFKEVKIKSVHIDSPDTRSYTYHLACMDRAEWTTDVAAIGFSVDLNAIYDVDLSRISSITSETSVNLTVLTNRKSICSWGFNEESNNYIETYDGEFKTTHNSRANGLLLGQNTLYFKCFDMAGRYSDTLTKTVISDTTPPVMVENNITSFHPDYPNPKIAPPLKSLNARMDAYDNETPRNIQYSYMLRSQFADSILVNWTGFSGRSSVAIRELDNGSSMDLKEGSYILSARSRNSVGLIGNEISDTITIDPTLQRFCENAQFDNLSESDLDCGLSCPPCADGKRCFVDADCISVFCNITIGQIYGICAPSRCDDGMQNGNETGIDCGGPYEKCGIGNGCETDDDCESGNCQYGTCVETDTCKDHRLTLSNFETDIDCGGDICPGRCEAGLNCIEHTDCQEGLRCKNEICTVCADNDLDCDGILNDKDDDIDGDGIPNWLDPDDDNDGLCDTALSPLNDPDICTGEDNDDDGDGILDYEDFDFDNDLDNDGVENHLDDDMDGDGIPNDEDPDDDNDGIPDELDEDSDNDGIPDRLEDDDNDGLSNAWEMEQGLDLNNPDTDGDGILDGDEDWDEDGLNNIEEEEWNTDPNTPDTDGDGWEDGKEVDRGTDPLDSEDKPKSYAWVYLLLMIVILGLIGGGYYGYMQYPDEINRVVDNVKIFAKKHGINLGKPSVPRVPARVPRRAVPRAPMARVPSRDQILARRKAEELKKEAFRKQERKDKAVAARPEKITKLKEILEPEKKVQEEWITLGKRPKSPRVEKAIEKLDKLITKKKAKPPKVEKKPETSELFRKLAKLKEKPSKDAMESTKFIAKAKKLSKDEIFRHLDTLSKDKKVKKKQIKDVLSHVIDKKKASRKDIKDILSSLAKKSKKKDIHKLLSKVKGKK